MSQHDRLIVIGTLAACVAAAAGLTIANADKAAPTSTQRINPMTKNTSAAEIRPFKVAIPDEALVDLRNRVRATRWPDKETVADQSQGVQLAKIQPLVQYWGTDYDWRKAEAKLNAYPQFITNIDGLDIHFIHVRSRHPHALPVVITHGWPGSVFELIKIIDPLTNPTAHGGRAEDAFDVVILRCRVTGSRSCRRPPAGSPLAWPAPGTCS